MRRSFRVATVFTGAAALAGGFGPTALAATTQTTAIHPDTPTNRICGANNGGVSHWVHLYYPNNDHPAECFHGSGYTNAGATIASFCPGNNGGYLHGSVSGVGSTFHFGPGNGRHPVSWFDGYRGNFHVGGISILSTAGTAKC